MSYEAEAERIDWSPLLGREPAPDAFATEAIANRSILITGAGGSIGSALARRLALSAPASLVLLDASEQALYELENSLDTPHTSILGNVSDPLLLDALFSDHRPRIVVHAAAFKHVTVVERNPFAGVANNALGTATLAEAASRHDVEQMILASTDKAADPASLMGASKRVAELILLAAAVPGKVVRLGNVLGSRGSVVPRFLEQLAAGLPLTLTHPDAQRYWLTMTEATAALLRALEEPFPFTAAGAGELVRVEDLARFLLVRAGQPTDRITLTGLRPGDKLTETLIARDERWAKPEWSPLGLRAIQSPVPPQAALCGVLDRLRRAVDARDLSGLLDTLQALVPSYEPSELLLAGVRR